MSIEVKVPSIYAPQTGGRNTAEVEGGTVGECLNNLVQQFPDLKRVLFDDKGQLHHHLDVYINQESSYPDEMTKPVRDGDRLDIVMVIAGG